MRCTASNCRILSFGMAMGALFIYFPPYNTPLRSPKSEQHWAKISNWKIYNNTFLLEYFSSINGWIHTYGIDERIKHNDTVCYFIYSDTSNNFSWGRGLIQVNRSQKGFYNWIIGLCKFIGLYLIKYILMTRLS